MTQDGKRAAVLVEHGFQELELWHPVMRFREEGAAVDVAGPDTEVSYISTLTYPVLPTASIASLAESIPDVIIVPGQGAGEKLSANPDAVALLKSAHEAGAVIGAIGTGALVLKEAGLISAVPSAPAAVTGTIVTSREANDLPEFVKAVLSVLAARPGWSRR